MRTTATSRSAEFYLMVHLLVSISNCLILFAHPFYSGFADTPIGDVVQFILNAQPPVVAPPMIAPPQQQIHQPPPMYAQGPPHEQPDPYNDSQLNSLLINLMDQLKQPPQPVHQQQPPPDYARHPSDPYYNAPPPSSPSHGDDMSSLLSTIQHLGSMGKGRQQY